MYEHISVEDWKEGKAKLPLQWWKHGKKIIWNNAKLTIKSVRKGMSTDVFSVELDEGNWPSDEDLITLCDNGVPPLATHFGGVVARNTRSIATVQVYVD